MTERMPASQILVALIAVIVRQGGQVTIDFKEYLEAGTHYDLRWDPDEAKGCAVLTAVRTDAPTDPSFRRIQL
jgi:hypothetical protein